MISTLIAHAIVTGPATVNTDPINCIGATLLVSAVACSSDENIVMADSMGNVWLPLGPFMGFGGAGTRLRYVLNPLVNDSQVFTAANGVAVCMCVAAFNDISSVGGSAAGGSTDGTGQSVDTGDLPATAPSELFVTAYETQGTGVNSVTDDFIITDSSPLIAGSSFGGAMAYKITSTSENPVWSNASGPGPQGAVMSSFVPIGGESGIPPARTPILLGNGTLAGTPVPPSCSVGISPDFYDTATRTLYTCVSGRYAVAAPPGAPARLKGEIFNNLPMFANNAAAKAGGLTRGHPYRTGGDPDVICVVH
jgi:hypothetical protein